jgi:hypothetical protein
LAISLDSAAARAGAVDYRVERSGTRPNLSLVGDIDPVNRIRFSR